MKNRLNRGVVRRGFALITVAIIGAVLVSCALLFVVQLQTERTVSSTDAVFKQALGVAEGGLNTVVSMIKANVKPPDGTSWGDHFRAGGSVAIGSVLSPAVPQAVYDVSVTAPASVVMTYNATTPALRIQRFQGTVTIMSTGRMFSPTTSSSLTSLTSGWTARRAVRSNFLVTWEVDTTYGQTKPGQVDSTTMSIKYGVYSGGNLSISGSSQEIHGDLFANGNVDVQKSSGIVGGVVYAGGSLSGAYPKGSKSGVPPIPFPTIDLTYFQAMFTAYCNGTAPYDGTYDGTNPAYTNMNPSTGAGQANRAKYNVAGLIANPADYSLYKDPTAVYYVNGPLTITSSVQLTGAIAVNGDFTIHGNTDITRGSSPLPTIIVKGDIVKENGNSNVEGVLMCSGTFTGNGSATITGALMAGGTVTMSGNLTVTYDDSVTDISYGGKIIPAETTSGGTSVTIYDLNQSPAGSRAWQEVQPQ